MTKAKLVLPAVFLAFLAFSSYGQAPGNVAIKVAVVDDALNLKSVPKFPMVVRLENADGPDVKLSTSADGGATLALAPGRYVIASEKALEFQGRSISWQHSFTVEAGKTILIDLSSDNAKIEWISASTSRRDISRGGEMFKTLRDGVVTVQGELGPGTGFILDEMGLVLTNHHVIDQSNEVRVRFDRHTAVKARVLAVDEERDLAVLQINMSAFPKGRALKVANRNGVEQPVIEGENIFTIGSPLDQDKILSLGVASKVEKRAIITDITFNSGNSGAPLFNSLGQVVGVTTFKVKDRSSAAFAKNEMTAEESGLSGAVAIEEAADLIAKAKAAAATKGQPSAQLMPNMPEGVFPVETIKAAFKEKKYPLDQYVSDVKNYQIKYMTPVYKFYVMEKDRIESLINRKKRNKEKGVDMADAFKDLRYWSEYAGELRPVVQILALPETGASGASMALSVIAQGTIGFSTPLDQKYKADFYQMKLMCDGQEIVPLIRNKTEIVRELQNYYKDRRRYTYAGVYSYPFEVFAPGRCRQMQVHVFSEEDIETPIVSDVSEVTKNRIWTDFKDFRVQTASIK